MVDAGAEINSDLVAELRWKEDMKKMAKGTRQLFMNDFSGAETTFQEGMQVRHEEADDNQEVRDLRGAFALQYALVSVIKGVASLANDQLDECLVRLWDAAELAGKDSDWLGRDVVRGIVTLVGGVVQCLQHSFVKGVYNVLKSWMWIKVLQTDAVDYVGKEREVVRSCALLTLGIFNVLLSLLPPHMLKAASYLSGFKGDREVGLKMLLDCWKEDGMFSAWGALVWVAYNIDTKTFLHEPLTAENKKECEAIFKWAGDEYKNSVFFSLIQADFFASKQQTKVSMQMLDDAVPFATELKALEWALNYKRGIYDLVDLKFEEAAVYFEKSIEVYVRVGRRSMVPFMAIYSFLCYTVAQQRAENGNACGKLDAKSALAKAMEMLAVVEKYKSMNKSNWGRQDKYAFRTWTKYATQAVDSDDFEEDDSEGDWSEFTWPLMDLAESMVLRMRCTRWMDDSQAETFLQMLGDDLQRLGDGVPDSEKIRMYAVVSQMLLERKRPLKSLEWCNKGLELESSVEDSGFLALLYYLKAVVLFQQGQMLDAKHSLYVLEQKMKKKSWIHHYVLFKSTLLKKQLDAEKDGDYTQFQISAGAAQEHKLEVKKGSNYTWEWNVVSHDVQFVCTFESNNGDSLIIDEVSKWKNTSGPRSGEYVPPEDGKITFKWDNSYSFLRSKAVLFKATC